jgi:ribosome recycling factor
MEMSIADVKKTAEAQDAQVPGGAQGRPGQGADRACAYGLLDHVQVEYYGSPVPINTVANVTLIDARTLGVQAWEKGMAAKVEKAIRDSDLGLNPAAQGDLIRVPMPALTEERRRDLIKVVKGEGEGAKVAVRNLRRDAIATLKEMLKNKECSEDEERRAQDEIQKLDRPLRGGDRQATQP